MLYEDGQIVAFHLCWEEPHLVECTARCSWKSILLTNGTKSATTNWFRCTQGSISSWSNFRSIILTRGEEFRVTSDYVTSCFGFDTLQNLCFPVFPSHSLVSGLIAIGVVVGGHIQVKEVFQLPLQSLKSRSVLFILLPAVHHDVIHDFGAGGGAWHPVALGNLLDNLEVCHGLEEKQRDIQWRK